MREGDRAVAFDDGKRRIRLQHLLHQRAALLLFLLVFGRQVHSTAAHTAAHATHPPAAAAHAATAAAHPTAATTTPKATAAATAVGGAAGVAAAGLVLQRAGVLVQSPLARKSRLLAGRRLGRPQVPPSHTRTRPAIAGTHRSRVRRLMNTLPPPLLRQADSLASKSSG